PIHSLLRGMRRVRTYRQDGVFVRVLDVEAALVSRVYGAAGGLRLRIEDPLGIVTGSYEFETDGAETSVSPTDGATVTLDVEDLGALLLGGRSAVELAIAGRIDGPTSDVERLDRLFRSARQPWSPIIF
ncbi:MAG: sterol carrier protein domain-containing protein, partial [Acidimicrobiia bacterium]